MSEHLVVALAFIVSVVVLTKPVFRFVRDMLSTYSKSIDADFTKVMDEKESLQNELVQQLEKRKSIDGEVKDILEKAKVDAEDIKSFLTKEVDQIVAQKVDYAIRVINNDISTLKREMESHYLDVTAEVLKSVIESYAAQKENSDFNRLSIEEIKKKLN